MEKYLILSMLGVVGFTMLSLFTVTTAFAQDTPYGEEYMQQHDGGDRNEYLQEMEHGDPWFYVPPSNDASLSVTTDNYPPAK
jgi:hypothetical protein